MIRIISIAFLLGGAVLIGCGISAADSLGSFSRFFTDSPTDKAVWMIIGGIIMAVIGMEESVQRTR